MKEIHGGNIWEASRITGLAPEKIVDFSASINPLGMSARARSAMKKAAALVEAYPEPDTTALRSAFALLHHVSPDEVLAGAGSIEFIHLIPQVLRPKAALIPEPAFSEYRSSVKLAGCRADGIVSREKNGFLPDLALLKDVLKKKSYDILYICNPANPTAALMRAGDLAGLAEFCSSVSTTLVVDEAFVDFCEQESMVRMVREFRNLLVLRSMTKFHAMAGLRLGFMVAHADMIKRFAAAKTPWSVNTLAAAAGAESLRDDRYMTRTRKYVTAEREYLVRELAGLKSLTVYDSPANFLMAKVGPGKATAPELKAALFEKGLLIRDLSSFAGLGRQYFRIAVKSRRENKTLVKALAGLLK